MKKEFLFAKPIWAKGLLQTKNVTCLFEAQFPRAEQARLKITACNFYRVYFNGEFLGYGPARAAHGYARVDEYALPCKEGVNRVTVEVAGYNCDSFYALNLRPFLQAEIVSGDTVIATGLKESGFSCMIDERRIRKSPRYSYQRAFSECYDRSRGLVETEIAVVPAAELLLRGVAYPKYREKDAAEAERGTAQFHPELPVYENRCLTQENIGIYTLGELECNPNALLSRLTYKAAQKRGAISKNEYAVYDLGTVKSGFIGICGRVKKACEIYLLFDEIDSRNDLSQGAMQIAYHRNDSLNFIYLKEQEGTLRFLSFEPYSFRYVKVVVFGGEIELERVYVKEYENPSAENFCFSCEDKTLNKIVEAAKNTFVQNAVDIPTDCPGRERAGWLCDSYFISIAERLFTGGNEVERNFLENYALAPRSERLPAGMVGMCYPADFEKDLFIPNWAMWYVLELESYFKRTGDVALVTKSKPVVYSLMEYFEKYRSAEGLLENLEGWIFIEWSGAGDQAFVQGVNFPSNMMYARALTAAATLYKDKSLKERAKTVKEAVKRYSFNGEFFEDNAVRENGQLKKQGHISETCQYYAFFTGIASPETYPALYQTLLKQFGPARDEKTEYPDICKSAAFIGDYLRLAVLTEQREYKQALDECKAYFSAMAERTGTLWEHESVTASLNHGFASYAAQIIPTCLGISPLDLQCEK